MKATIELIKQRILDDIDAVTYKRMESTMAGQPESVQNSLSSDSHEELDKGILHRYMQTRDAHLRRKLAFCLVKEQTDEIKASNRLKTDEPSFIYVINVPEGFDSNAAEVLADLMHRYIADGSIFDWYAYQHMECFISAEMLKDMENEVSRQLRKSYVSRPLQPFGPQKRR